MAAYMASQQKKGAAEPREACFNIPNIALIRPKYKIWMFQCSKYQTVQSIKLDNFFEKKVDFIKIEHEMLDLWKDEDTFEKLREKNIVIAFPQRDVHLYEVPKKPAKKAAAKEEPEKKTTSKKAPAKKTAAKKTPAKKK